MFSDVAIESIGMSAVAATFRKLFPLLQKLCDKYLPFPQIKRTKTKCRRMRVRKVLSDIRYVKDVANMSKQKDKRNSHAKRMFDYLF